jgi:hypothetical protein
LFSGLAAVALVTGLFLDILGAPEALTRSWPADLGPIDGLPLALYAIAAAFFVLGLFGTAEKRTASRSRTQ